MDADTGQIVGAKDVDDGAEVNPLIAQLRKPVSSFTADGAYDQDGVSVAVVEHFPEAATIVPPRSTAVLSETAEAAPTQRSRHLRNIAKHGRAAWQKACDYTKQASAEVAISQFKRVTGDGLRSCMEECRATEVDVAIHVLNRTLDLGRPFHARIA